MSAPEYRYWDSNCFLAWIKGEVGRAEVCDSVLRAAHRGEILIVTSAITLAEVVRPRRKGTVEMTEAEDAKIVAFFRSPFLRFVDFNPTMGQQTRQLQWRYGLHVRDAIHVASAIAARVGVIESYDQDLLRIDRRQVPACPEIREPKGESQKSLFQSVVEEQEEPTPQAPAPQAQPADPAMKTNAQDNTEAPPIAPSPVAQPEEMPSAAKLPAAKPPEGREETE